MTQAVFIRILFELTDRLYNRPGQLTATRSTLPPRTLPCLFAQKMINRTKCVVYLSWFGSKLLFSLLPVQVWFQNRRARTLKCKGAKKALWQSDSPVHDALPPSHAVASWGQQLDSVHLPPQGPPPAYPTQVKEELEEACYYGQRPPAYSTNDEHRHHGSIYGFQGRQLGGSSSPPLRGFWSQPGSQTSPVPSLWCHSPQEMQSYGSNSSQAAFIYPGSAEQQMYMPCSTSHSSTPDTPDSGYWDASLESSPPLEGQYSQLEDSWSGAALEGCGESRHTAAVQHAPLPELSLQEILGELDEDWLGGEGLDSQVTGDKMAFC